MPPEPVFYDPRGRRPRLIARLAAGAGLVLGVTTTLFALSLLVIPLLPKVPGLSGPGSRFKPLSFPGLPVRRARLSRFLVQRTRAELWREMEITRQARGRRRATRAQPGGRILAAFYAPWQETSLHSLRANADRLTHLMPEWLHLNPTGDGLDFGDWDTAISPYNKDAIRIARDHHLQVLPILNNSTAGRFDPVPVHRLFGSPAAQQAQASALRAWLLRNRCQGLSLDLENLFPGDYARLPEFVRTLADTLHRAGLSLSLDVEAGGQPVPLKELVPLCDLIVLMAYDEHWASGDPGPISSLPWFGQVLSRALQEVPPDKLVVGLGNYAYDWAEGRRPAEALSYQSALNRARDYHQDLPPQRIVDFDSVALNPTFEYRDDSGASHEVWILDAVTTYNQWKMARKARVRGLALWALGLEDPGIWDFLDNRSGDSLPPPVVLEKIAFPYEVEFDGSGEILSVAATPQEGERQIEVEDRTGLITDEQYLRFPSSYIIKRTGYHPGWIALTFDDGPHPVFTPMVLEALKRLGVAATFFVVGENAERYPDLVQREFREGHEIGSHTFTHPNMGAVSERRAELELNTTQRVIQGILGRSTILFRVPYNADAEPVSGEEIRPLITASHLGYLTIGELLDPQDWKLWKTAPGKARERRTEGELVQAILQEVHSTPGNVLLLHDGGGDRVQTAQALLQVVPELKKEGYRFVTASELLGLSRDAVMPPLTPKDLSLIRFDKGVFEAVFTTEILLGLLFMVAIFLGLGRVLFIATLAFVARGRDRSRALCHDYRPPVSVLIAAYNEQAVIGRTIRSILTNDYPGLEVVVVDDGSQDGTSEEVERAFRGEPRVRIFKQANAGKGAALNHALEEAEGEVLVCLDADTQIAPDAIALLVQPFADPKVGAVAGNVKVGNRINLFTRWQAIEYITSQNLDRRAYALLNAVPVVPGAIGAWRKSTVLELGGYDSDTLAEDTDLTWRLRRAGFRIANESRALGYTEAPETLRAFFKQRFRWAFGTLQCLWKHRGALCRYGWFGWLALPSLWLFQVLFQVIAPFVDLEFLYALGSFANSWMTRGLYQQDWQPLPQAIHLLLHTGFYYALFFTAELITALIAFGMDRERKRLLWGLFWQRFVYRQLMYAVIWKSLWRALRGFREGWGKLARKGTVRVGEAV